MAVKPWTLTNIVAKVQDDLDLHDENFTDDIKQWINDAIDDYEELTIDCFSDYLLCYSDLSVTAAQTEITLPDDLYESRIRGIYYSQTGFASNSSGDTYKLRRMSLERVTDVSSEDDYQYRLINTTAGLQKLMVFPAIRETSSTNIRMWYIRKFNRLDVDTDLLEKGIRIQYILAHVKCSAMQKAGDPMLDVEAQKLMKQEDKAKNSLSRLTDDSEGDYLEPDDYALDEAYGDY